MELPPWEPVSPGRAVALALGSGAVIALALISGGFIPLIDHANLAFHEAGHPLFGIFGETAALYGGTLGQLAFPVATMVAFFLRRQPIGCAVGAVWFFQNVINIARYLADARAQELPLVGGGEHDWANILPRWGALDADLRIARVLVVLACVGAAAVVGWVFMRSRADAE